MMKRGVGNKGQVAIYIIVAILLVIGIVVYFVVSGSQPNPSVSSKFEPIQTYFSECVAETAAAGISILEERGGFIYAPDFEPGNIYSPQSNHLGFMGTSIPYWLYFSGNDIVREQVPAKKDMELQLKRYLEENLYCDFENFYQQGFDVNLSSISATAEILSNEVKIRVNGVLGMRFDAESAIAKEHSVAVKTKLGKFYDLALKIYNQEKTDSFLEDYAVDALYLYAPVSGVELTCSPKVWMLNEVSQELKEGLEANTLMLRGKGNYYSLSSDANKYFITDVGSDEAVRYLYSKDWPTKIEVEPQDGEVLVAEPVGAQEGLGMLGFCYAPYHYIYDLSYPVLVQLYDSKELFQFPLIVYVEANQKRNPLSEKAIADSSDDFCKYKNNPTQIYTYNNRFEPVEADIRFKCMNEVCDLGRTETIGSEAVLETSFPQCVNGIVIARAEGYADKKIILSTNEEAIGDIVFDKLYTLPLSLRLRGSETGDMAVIYFKSEKHNTVVSWPEQKTIKLVEGEYNVSVYVYRNSSITISGSTTNKCVDVAKPGILGLFGQTKEECFDLTIPSQELSNVIVGGGKSFSYVPESEIEAGKRVVVSTESLALPRTIEQLQDNYNALEENGVHVTYE